MMNFNKNLGVSALTLSLIFVLGMPGQTALAASPAGINLGTSGNFVILAKTGISTTGTTSIVGDLGLSPAAASYITGFALILPAASAFSTSAIVNGKIYAPGYADPTPTNLTTAVLDMQTAYTDGMGRAADVTELGAGNIGGLTLAPGVYKWGTGVTIPTDLTLSGGAQDTWIFQVAQNLSISSGVKVILAGGAQANNIFWVVAGQATIGTGAVFNGNILGQTAIVFNTGATLNGRALAQSAVTLDSNIITMSVSTTPASTSTGGANSSQIGGGQGTQTTTPPPSSNANVIALQAQLNGLLAIAQSLQAQVKEKQNSSVTASAFGQQMKTIAINLREGSRDNAVATLQQFLISQNKGSAARALSEHGVTTYFGVLTRAALAEFQANVGIAPAFGNFGVITRGYIKANY